MHFTPTLLHRKDIYLKFRAAEYRSLGHPSNQNFSFMTPIQIEKIVRSHLLDVPKDWGQTRGQIYCQITG